MRPSLLFLLFSLLINDLSAQGAWTRPAKKIYAQTGVYAITPSRALSLFGFKSQKLHRAVSEWTIPTYIEYGIVSKFTIYTQIPLKMVMTGSKVFAASGGVVPSDTARPAGIVVGLGNTQLGFRYNFFNKGLVLSLDGKVSAPGVGWDSLRQLSVGYRAWDFTPMLCAGVSGEKWYLQFCTGMHLRTNGYSHQWQGMLEMGYKTKKGAYLGWVLDSRLSVNKTKDIPYSDNQTIYTGLYINRQDYLAWLLKASVPFKKDSPWGMTLFLGGGLLVNHIQQSPSIGVSVYYKNG